MNPELKEAIMDAVSVQLERDDGFPVSDETIASALNAVAKIQQEYYKAKEAMK